MGHHNALGHPIASIGNIKRRRLSQLQLVRIRRDNAHALVLQTLHQEYFAEHPPQPVIDLNGAIGRGGQRGAEFPQLQPAILE